MYMYDDDDEGPYDMRMRTSTLLLLRCKKLHSKRKLRNNAIARAQALRHE